MFVYFASLIRSWSNRELFRNWFPETEIQANIVCMWPLNAKGALVCERQEARELAGFPNTSRNQKSQRRCNMGFIGCWGICLNTVLFAINKSVFPFLSCKCDPIMPSEFSLLLKGEKKKEQEKPVLPVLPLRYIITLWATVLYSENNVGVWSWMCSLLFLWQLLEERQGLFEQKKTY